MISTRDVTFDPSQGYNPNDKFDISDEILETLKVPDLEVESIQERIEIEQLWEAREVDGLDQVGQLKNSIVTEKEKEKEKKIKNVIDKSSSGDSNDIKVAKWKGYVDTFDEDDGKPTQEIYGNPNDPRNIIQGKRRRFPKTQFHMEVHDNLKIQAAFHTAFFQGSRHMKSRIHEKDLPPPPENWNQMLKHP